MDDKKRKRITHAIMTKVSVILQVTSVPFYMTLIFKILITNNINQV